MGPRWGLACGLFLGTIASGQDDQPRPNGPPPRCPHALGSAARRPPARTMPELFGRMGEGFARNPGGGFQSVLDELARLEGPALRGITLSPAEERRAGRQARDEFLRRVAARGHRVVDDPIRTGYLRALAGGLARRMTHRDRYPRLEVTLVKAPIADGQSFPGGFLVFTTALLEQPDEATVAGVVAHELAHLDLGHLYDYARRAKLAEANPWRGASPDQAMTRQMAMLGLLMNPHRPEHETEADCAAVTWLHQEGYDPRALADFFERIHDRPGDGLVPPFFTFRRSHPESLDRRRHCLARLERLQRWQPREDLGRFPDHLRCRCSRFQDDGDREDAQGD